MANTVINTPELLNLDSTTGATILAKGTISERPSIPTFNADYLIIAGGGGGGGGRGGNATVWSAGGGGGGYQYSTGIKLLIDTNYTITVGAGGAGGTGNGTPISSDGENSSIVASGIINEVATGGIGGGKSQGGAGGASGSLPSNSGGTSYSAGAYWGAGGGAGIGSNGSNGSSSSGGAGGNGLQFSITGTATYYSGGGGGGIYQLNNGGSGGLGGGGNGKGTTANGDNGLVNTGGGGGGAGSTGASAGVNFTGGTGGSGIVILRYPNSYTINIGAGLTSSTITDGSEKVTSFTSGTGTITFTDSTSTNPDEYPINGTLRFNTDTNKTEYYDGTGWYEIVDEYANGYDGIPTNYFDTKLYTGNGATQSIGGYINGAASFNGSSSKIDLGNNSSNNSSTISVSLWFKTSGHSGNGTLINNGGANSGETGYYLGLNSNGTIKFEASTGTINGSVNYADSNWHQIVLTLNNGAYNIYVDGNTTPVITGSGAFTGTATRPTWIGQFSYTVSAIEFFNGSIDQVRIYNVALSSSDVAALNLETAATSTTAAFPSGQTAVATYTMDTSANGLLNTQDLSTVNYPAGAGCVALYEMNGNVNDTSGTYNGTPTNITYEGGAFDQAAVFNGSSSKIVIPASTSIAQQNNYTFSAWFKTDTLGVMQTIYAFNSPSTYQSAIFIHSNGTNNIRIFSAGNNYYSSNNIYTNNQWYHIAVTKSSTNGIVAYLDGVSIINEPTATANNLQPSAGDNRIGAYKTSAESLWFDGLIDQVRIFNTALTQSQVTTLARGIATSYSGAATNVNFNGHLDFQPDFTWLKSRDDVRDHRLFDSVRGATKGLYSNLTNAEFTENSLIAFNTNGFSLGSAGNQNNSNEDYVSWNWKAGGTAVTNNDGTIASQVSANKDAGFSIVKWNGNGTTSQTVGHGLSSAPQVVIMKSISGNSAWYVLTTAYSTINPAYLQLESVNQANSATFTSTSTTFTNFAYGGDTIAYCFAETSGFSKIDSYTGTGAAGKSVTTGFEPSWLMVKRTNGTGDWNIWDARRGSQSILWANGSNAEATNSVYEIEFVSTGFVINATASFANGSGDSYIYMAFA